MSFAQLGYLEGNDEYYDPRNSEYYDQGMQDLKVVFKEANLSS